MVHVFSVFLLMRSRENSKKSLQIYFASCESTLHVFRGLFMRFEYLKLGFPFRLLDIYFITEHFIKNSNG